MLHIFSCHDATYCPKLWLLKYFLYDTNEIFQVCLSIYINSCLIFYSHKFDNYVRVLECNIVYAKHVCHESCKLFFVKFVSYYKHLGLVIWVSLLGKQTQQKYPKKITSWLNLRNVFTTSKDFIAMSREQTKMIYNNGLTW